MIVSLSQEARVSGAGPFDQGGHVLANRPRILPREAKPVPKEVESFSHKVDEIRFVLFSQRTFKACTQLVNGRLYRALYTWYLLVLIL